MIRSTSVIFLLLALLSCSPVIFMDHYADPVISQSNSIKIVHVKNDKLIHNVLETQFIRNGWNLVSQNTIPLPSTSSHTVTTMDTTYRAIRNNSNVMEIFKDVESDYVLKYDYRASLTGSYLYLFNATLISTENGKILGTYTYREGGGFTIEDFKQVIEDMLRKFS